MTPATEDVDMNDDVVEDDLEVVESPDLPTDLSRHAGEPLAADADLFVPAPAEIGPLLSADSTLTTGKNPVSPGARWMLIGGLMMGVYYGLVYLAGTAQLQVSPGMHIFSACVGLIAGLSAWFATRFSHVCSYVGQK